MRNVLRIFKKNSVVPCGKKLKKVLRPERFPYCDINRFPDLNDILLHLPLKLTCQDEPLSVLGVSLKEIKD